MLRGYVLDRATRHQDDIDAVIDALDQFRQGGDLADQLILACVTSAGALPVLSFDRRFSASAGIDLLQPG